MHYVTKYKYYESFVDFVHQEVSTTPKQFQIEMPFAPPSGDRAMLDAHFLSAVADLLVFATS